jgi:hypothetical protein
MKDPASYVENSGAHLTRKLRSRHRVIREEEDCYLKAWNLNALLDQALNAVLGFAQFQSE